MAKASENNNDMPVRATMCPTCPFRPGSKYAYLKDDLELSARTTASRICHSTGSDNAINTRTGFPPYICRGAREIQLEQFHVIGLLSEPTDDAWNDKREQMGMARQVIGNPVRGGV